MNNEREFLFDSWYWQMLTYYAWVCINYEEEREQ